jgi:hypothetical protein
MNSSSGPQVGPAAVASEPLSLHSPASLLPIPDPFAYIAYTTSINPMAYPAEDQVRCFNLSHEWLAQVILYGVYA